jgi:hypothetical protein
LAVVVVEVDETVEGLVTVAVLAVPASGADVVVAVDAAVDVVIVDVELVTTPAGCDVAAAGSTGAF